MNTHITPRIEAKIEPTTLGANNRVSTFCAIGLVGNRVYFPRQTDTSSTIIHKAPTRTNRRYCTIKS